MSAVSTLLIWIYFFTVISINPHIGTDTLIFIKVGKRLTKLMIVLAIYCQDVEEVLTDAEMNKLMKQADYIRFMSMSYKTKSYKIQIL